MPGYRMIKGEDDIPRVVYCDMEKLPGHTGFQRLFSSPGNMRQFVAFDVFLEDPVTDNFRYISFSQSLTDLGADFRTEDGIFVVPVTGVYLFSVHALPRRNKPLNIQLHRNGKPVATISNGRDGTSMPGQVVILDIVQGDQIRLYNYGGEIEGSGNRVNTYFHFVGVLLFANEKH